MSCYWGDAQNEDFLWRKRFLKNSISKDSSTNPNIWCTTLVKTKRYTWERVNDSCARSKPNMFFLGQPIDVRNLANPKKNIFRDKYLLGSTCYNKKTFYRQFEVHNSKSCFLQVWCKRNSFSKSPQSVSGNTAFQSTVKFKKTNKLFF